MAGRSMAGVTLHSSFPPNSENTCTSMPFNTEQPESFDSLFIDDDVDGDLEAFDDGSFTMINRDDFSPSTTMEREPHTHQLTRRYAPTNDAEQNTAAKMKSKIVTFWHNVKYGSWSVKPKSNFNKKKPIFLLSKCYDWRGDSPNTTANELELMKALRKFRQDFTSRIWITYRQGFVPISDTQITSDGGWGCMIRSGQMMLAQAMVLHYLTRDWDMFSANNDKSQVMHREIIRWFSDQPGQRSPFSIHRLVKIGKSLGREAGDWYGPATVASILETACQQASEFTPLLNQICLYVAHDCTIYKEDVLEVATSGYGSSSSSTSLTDTWKSTIILIPVRLGTESLNSIYIPCLKGLFFMESFLGIIGGKPKHSLYFVGFQDNKLIHLDPHLMQDTVDTSKRDFPLESYHCGCPRKLSFESMDPSCALGFYCRTEADFGKFIKDVQPYLIPPGTAHNYPMFVVSEGSRSEHFNI